MVKQNNTAELTLKALVKLKLDKQPFDSPETEAEFFQSAAFRILVSDITQQVLNNDSIHLIKGEYGIGKSTLCDYIKLASSKKIVPTLVQATASTSTADILYALIDTVDNGAVSDTQVLAVDAANKIFRILRNNQQPLLIIDDAHLLSQNVVRKLIKFATAIANQNYGYLKLLLVGEREIESIVSGVDAEVIDVEKIYSTLMRPLNIQDIENYIRFRFRQAIAIDEMPLSKEQLDNVRANCGGLPRNIDLLVCDALNTEISKRLLGFGKKIRYIAVFLFISIVALMLYQMQTRNTIAPFDKWFNTVSESAAPENIVTTIVSDESDQLANQSPEASNISADVGNIAVESDAQDQIANIESSVEDELDILADALDAGSDIINVDSAQDWLLKQSPNHVVLQIVATSNLESLQELSRNISVSKPLVIYEVPNRQSALYLLLSGPFDDRVMAMQLVRELPYDIQNNDPWPRTVQSLLQ